MKHALVIALVLAAAPAAAQPAAEPCAVTYVRAPDDVRTVIDSWVRAEPRCNSSLELRVIPTEGGLYLIARDSVGRLRERLVPDAQSAGVLVASWVAAESMASPYDVRRPPAPVPPQAMLGSEGLLGPGEGMAPGAAPVIVRAAPQAAPGKPRWLSLGAMVAMSGIGGGGIRGEADLAARGFATFGIAASASRGGMEANTYDAWGKLETFDAKLVGYIALTSEHGGWHWRATGGAGLAYTAAVLDQPSLYMSRDASGFVPTVELSGALGAEIGKHWSLDVGPVLSLYFQEYEIESSGSNFYSYETVGRDPELMMYLTVRHRL